MGTATFFRFHYRLKETFLLEASMTPAKAHFFAMGIGFERRLAVQDRNESEMVDVRRTMPMLLLTRSRGGPATGRCGGHAQVSRQAKHYAHRGINALMSCDKAFQNPCHSAKREQNYVQEHIRICTHGVKTGLG